VRARGAAWAACPCERDTHPGSGHLGAAFAAAESKWGPFPWGSPFPGGAECLWEKVSFA